MAKNPPPPLGRAPRPRPSGQEMSRVLAETQDLGFGRVRGEEGRAPRSEDAPAEPAPVPPVEAPVPAPVETEPARAVIPSAAPAVPETADDDEQVENLRIPVSRRIWDQLTVTAHRRRVTVRYLCLEALAQAGYDVDMSKIPPDGRRIKKPRDR